jgi:hypothetical protein
VFARVTGSPVLSWRRDPLSVDKARAINELFHRHWTNAGSAALARQVELNRAWIARTAPRSLEDTQAGFNPVVCRQTFIDNVTTSGAGPVSKLSPEDPPRPTEQFEDGFFSAFYLSLLRSRLQR